MTYVKLLLLAMLGSIAICLVANNLLDLAFVKTLVVTTSIICFVVTAVGDTIRRSI